MAAALHRIAADLNWGAADDADPGSLLTDTMLRAMAESVRGLETDRIHWDADTATNDKQIQRENTGNGLVGLLEVDLPDFRVSQGFLALVCRVSDGRIGNLEGLKAHCESLLQSSAAAFVFLCRPEEVSMVPATAVVGSMVDPTELYTRSAQRFFEEHLESFIGDPALRVSSEESLKDLVERLALRGGILIRSRSLQMALPVTEARPGPSE
jgi:hypothetical protein